MIGYILRRIAYGFLILLGVNALTFALFFAVNTPDDMARLAIGGRYVTSEAIENWKTAHGYDLPLVYNDEAQGIEKITKTVFYTRSAPLLTGDLGLSDAGRSINREIAERVGPSLALAVPTFVLGVFVMLVFSLMVVLVRRTKLEWAAVAFAVTVMSVSSLFYIILGQWLFAKTLRLVPVSGFMDGWRMAVFLILPVAIGIFSRLGSDTLLYRAMFLEEVGKDYVRTARAKGGVARPRHVRACAQKRYAADFDEYRGSVSDAFHGKPHHGELFRHSGAGLIHDRCHQRAGLFHCPRHGFFGYRGLCAGAAVDGHCLHDCRSAHSVEIRHV